MNQEKNIPIRELLFIIGGELITSLVIIAVYLAIGKFDYTVVTGALLGSLVIILNFVFLTVSVNRAFDSVLEGASFSSEANAKTVRIISETEDEEDDGEEDTPKEEDEIAKFAKENEGKLSAAIRISYILRTASMLGALVIAIVTKRFNLIALVIPLFMQRPLLSLSALTKKDTEG